MSESPEPSSTPLPPSGDSGDSGPVPHLEWDAFPGITSAAIPSLNAPASSNRGSGALAATEDHPWAPELRESHTGENIASQVAEVIESFEIQDKIGYFTLDNAKNNDTAVAALGHVFNFEGKQRRVRCFGHIINLVAKALLFGKDNEVFKSEERLDLDLARHDLWRKRGPIGKLHNLVHWIHQSDRLTYMLRDLQRKRDSTKKPVDVVTDNMTRWLSHYKMMDRALLLHDFLDDLVALEQFEYTRSRSKKKDMPACLRDSDLLTGNDWTVISHFRNILKHFENAIKALEGDAQIRVRKGGNLVAYRTAWDIIQAFEYLLERLEEAKEFAKDVPDSEHFAINVELGWKKLEKYYIKLVECPVYYAAVALHPALRLQWFEEAWAHRPEWVLEARRIVRGIWERDYKSLILSDDEAIPMVKRRKVDDLNEFQQFRLRHRLQAGQTATTRRGPPTADEFDRWTVDIGADDGDITDPFQYWQLKESTYPRLARMAFDMLSIPPMSAEPGNSVLAEGRANTHYQEIIDASVDDDVFPEEVPHEGREVDGVEDLK
ncbi:transposase-like protein [Hirsutella rhossiliensis]